MPHITSNPAQVLEKLLRDDPGRLLSVVIRAVGDFDLAEEVLQEAAASALKAWAEKGVPENPAGWLVATARNRAIDRFRKSVRERTKLEEAAHLSETFAAPQEIEDVPEIPDERLRLIFTCCHPALAADAQIALTLRTLGGLTTPEIAHAFLVPEPTMGQRLVRAKAKIKKAQIPYEIPSADKLGERIGGVITVLYLIFNEGYIAAAGKDLMRLSLTGEAIRLARLLVDQLPAEPEAKGLLALMLFHEARNKSRVGPDGALLLLDEQDRSLWDRSLIVEANKLLEQAIEAQNAGPFQLQAAIAGLHANAPTPQLTDWRRISDCYDHLHELTPTSVVALNRVAAHAMARGPEAGLMLLDAVEGLDHYHLYHSTRGDLLRRTARLEEAKAAYEAALDCVTNDIERAFLERRLANVVAHLGKSGNS